MIVLRVERLPDVILGKFSLRASHGVHHSVASRSKSKAKLTYQAVQCVNSKRADQQIEGLEVPCRITSPAFIPIARIS